MRFMVLVSVLAVGSPLAAQGKPAPPSRYKEIDQLALDTPAAVEQSLTKLAAYLSKQGKTPEEKARILYRWITDRIAYDADSFLAGKTITSIDPGRVLLTGKTSCFGYANLYETLGKLMGLEVVTIHGHTKGYGYTPGDKVTRNHSWNAVKIDGKWGLIDVTFGAGVVEATKGYSKRFEDYYFFTPPEQLIFDHFPENPKAQMLKVPVNVATYRSWPLVRYQLFKGGLTPKAIQDAIARKDLGGLVIPFDAVADGIVFIDIPLHKNLDAGESYTFKLQVPVGTKPAVILNRKKFVDMQKVDDHWEVTVPAEKGVLHVGIQFPAKGPEYLTILEYAVGEGKQTIKVALIQSTTGMFAAGETWVTEAETLAIEEINKAGGVLGRRIVPFLADPESQLAKYPEVARKSLKEDEATVVFGGSVVTRRHLMPVFEENEALLFVPANYEGADAAKNVIGTGALPSQQLLPAVTWLQSKEGGERKRFYLVGSDCSFARTTALFLRSLKGKDLDFVGGRYTPLGHEDFAEAVRDIRAKNPDVIINALSGASNAAFFKELTAQGVTAEKSVVVSFLLSENDLRGLEPAVVKGHLAVAGYFESLDLPQNKRFVRAFKERFGNERVVDDAMASAYTQVHLWKLAVDKAKSAAADKVREVLLSGGIEFDGPQGRTKIDPKSLHASKTLRIGRIRGDGQFDVIHASPGAIAPDLYPAIAFPGWSVDWTKGGVTRGAAVAP
ncbi:MAG: transporter substrate-binding protein [Gemmataceae bacterium]